MQIEAARKDGAQILNDSDGAGYYISDRVADLRQQYRSNHSRAMSILQQSCLRRRIGELEEREAYRRTLFEESKQDGEISC